MNPVELKVARVGNSRGVRIPAAPKLSWEDSARAMAADAEGWRVWNGSAGDGLDDLPWEPARPRRVTEM